MRSGGFVCCNQFASVFADAVICSGAKAYDQAIFHE
ncbi:hypothetical protein APH_0887 [Anaplasma phagocytophilum str. HZ]|uniref:Uncharacterized protein n=1 Tax=Anaplasma phagocytophilum (strain HZ) TaxID=212042 RepID=Q2GJI8_ANAPZ|nr:hypothetical protein APH_0887 [Anaplasma phagocytophilum str. HZ]